MTHTPPYKRRVLAKQQHVARLNALVAAAEALRADITATLGSDHAAHNRLCDAITAIHRERDRVLCAVDPNLWAKGA